ncbi:MAG: type II toxin-antitoxin system VapC family toxin [Wenzhouxiangellaceae bacterium]|nr:type II toxin-antitoxin system VapC family toxin [Wenzhouxiangellaceae bacterium]
MNSFLVDTDVLIDFLRGYGPAVEWLRQARNRPLVSVITVAELRAGMRAGEESALESLFGALLVLPVDERIARQAGDLRRQFGPRHGTGLADALIAATAIVNQARLVSLNVRHYPMIDEVVQPYLKD